MSGLVTKLTEIFWTVPLYDAQSLKNVALQCLQAYIFFVNTVQKVPKPFWLRNFFCYLLCAIVGRDHPLHDWKRLNFRLSI